MRAVSSAYCASQLPMCGGAIGVDASHPASQSPTSGGAIGAGIYRPASDCVSMVVRFVAALSRVPQLTVVDRWSMQRPDAGHCLCIVGKLPHCVSKEGRSSFVFGKRGGGDIYSVGSSRLSCSLSEDF
jgi:hypothetical protein